MSFEVLTATAVTPALGNKIPMLQVSDNTPQVMTIQGLNDLILPPLTWTPILRGLTTAGTPTYTRQVGKATRVNDLVFYNVDIAISAIGGMVGDLLIDGFPFTSNASPIAYPASIGSMINYTLAASTFVAPPHVLGNNTRMRLQKQTNTGMVPMVATDIASNFLFSISGHYKI